MNNHSSARLLVFDLVKLILAFLVVNLHVESFVTHAPFSPWYFLGWYAVPLFAAFTFYFLGRDFLAPLLNFWVIRRRVVRVLLPFAAWSAVGFLLHPDLLTPKYLLRQLLTGTAVDPPLYYLLASAILLIGFSLLGRFGRSSRIKILLGLVVLSLALEQSGLMHVFLQHVPIQINFFLARLLELAKYAALGVLLAYFQSQLLTSHHSVRILPTLAAFALTATITLQALTQPSNLNYAGIVQFITITLILCSLIWQRDFRLPSRWEAIITWAGRYILGIYCLHTFFIELVNYSGLLPQPLPLSLGIFLLCLAISALLDRLSHTGLRPLVS